MIPGTQPRAGRTIRRDGWTAERRQQFLDCLTAGADVRRACAIVGLSREGAYRLRGRDAGFAQAWDAALRKARATGEERFLALLPEKLRRTMSALSGVCELRGPESGPRTVSEPSGACELRAAEIGPRTVSTLSGLCELQGREGSPRERRSTAQEAGSRLARTS